MANGCVGWEPSPGEFPFAPVNIEVVHPYIEGCLDIRWDDPSILSRGPIACGGPDNSKWNIVGQTMPTTTSLFLLFTA